MKHKIAVSLLLMGSSFSLFAQGYKDGVEYYKVNQFEKAKILLERNLDKPETDKAESYYYLGRIALGNNDVAGAKGYFDKGIAVNAANPYNYIGLGVINLKNGNAKEAASDFKNALSKVKKDPKVYVAIARAYAIADPTLYAKEIEKNIKQAKKIDKTDPTPYVFEGDMLTAEKKWGDAAGYYEMAENFDKNCSEAYVKYANTYFYVNPSVAIDKLKSLLAANPNSALAQRELAEKYYENDQWTLAAEAYGEYIKNPNHFREDEERYAVLLYFGENYQQSYDLAKQILAKNPNSFLMKRMVFLDMAKLGKNEEAEKLAVDFFNSSNPNDKYSSNDYITYGEVLKALGKTKESLAQYEKAVEINPEKVDLLKELSSAYGNAEDYEKSALYYQKFVDAGDYKTNDLYALAGKYQNIIATEKDSIKKDAAFQNAIKYIDMVLERVPDDYRIHQRKARILLVNEADSKEGKAVDAYKQMLVILDADPQNITKNSDAYREAYSYLAGYELKNGNKENAKAFYMKYLEVDPTNQELRDYIDKNLK